MNLSLNCPHCHNLLEVDAGWAGHQLDCPLCHNSFTVPFAPVARSVSHAPQITPPEMPKLWNPNAAASWSVLFGPAFGPYLHHLNWRALGDHGKAASAFRWFIVGLVITIIFSIGVQFSPEFYSKAFAGSIFFLAIWLYSSGKKQASFVKEQFGENYQRRSWWQPILAGFGFLFLMGVILTLAVGGVREEMVAQQSVKVVNEILTRSNIGSDVRCIRVQLSHNAGPDDYFATAFFTTGDSAPARVQVHGDVVMVNLEPATIVALQVYQAINSFGKGQGNQDTRSPATTNHSTLEKTGSTGTEQLPDISLSTLELANLNFTVDEWLAKVEATVGSNDLRALQRGSVIFRDGIGFLKQVGKPMSMEARNDNEMFWIWPFKDGHVAITVAKEAWEKHHAIGVLEYDSGKTAEN